MPRILGVDIPENKKILFSLQYIYGIGPKRAEYALKQASVDPEKRANEVTRDEVSRITRALEQYPLEGDLRRQVNDNVDRLKRIKAYRGIRHIMKLPVRGQRTRTNSRVSRSSAGRRRTVGSMTKEMASKLETAKKK